jgi:hypothetical protein
MKQVLCMQKTMTASTSKMFPVFFLDIGREFCPATVPSCQQWHAL